MTILITGGAGFIGRWVVRDLLNRKISVVILDNLSNGRLENISEFEDDVNLNEVIIGDITDKEMIGNLFKKYQFEKCIHLAAQINVQESLDHPERSFNNNIIGTYNILEECTKYRSKLILIGTCMVYDLANSQKPISETHDTKPASPYAGSKLAAEEIALSYYYGFKLPVVILRPFNVYGPFQKTNMEGGVVSIFVKRKLQNKNLMIYGDGTQTRDLMYVEDCADFIVKSVNSTQCVGQIINGGTGKDISINNLAQLIIKNKEMIEHVPHHHPQSEIMKLVCNNSKAKELLGWEPKISLEEGINKLELWLKENELN